MAHKMAIESSKVIGDVVEATEFPELVQLYRVSGVPKTIVNERVEFVGAQPEARFLQEVLRSVQSKGNGGVEAK